VLGSHGGNAAAHVICKRASTQAGFGGGVKVSSTANQNGRVLLSIVMPGRF